MNKFCVYKHTFPNAKIYIGITSMKPSLRWRNGYGYRKQPYVFNAILKYGWDNIKHEILFTDLTQEEAEEKEIELINYYKSTCRKYGYNRTNGGNSAGTMAEETKQRISKKLKGIPKEKAPFEGKKHTSESKQKLSEKRKGINNPMYGKKASDETKKKMSESHINNGKLSKPIRCIETGEVFLSTCDVARKMNLSQGTVAMVARGERKQTKGYHFEYLKKEA